jgi:hypothetical protein
MPEPNRRGRPRLDPLGRRIAPVTVTFTAAEFDAATKVAALRRESIQEVIRRGLRRELRHPKEG